MGCDDVDDEDDDVVSGVFLAAGDEDLDRGPGVELPFSGLRGLEVEPCFCDGGGLKYWFVCCWRTSSALAGSSGDLLPLVDRERLCGEGDPSFLSASKPGFSLGGFQVGPTELVGG